MLLLYLNRTHRRALKTRRSHAPRSGLPSLCGISFGKFTGISLSSPFHQAGGRPTTAAAQASGDGSSRPAVITSRWCVRSVASRPSLTRCLQARAGARRTTSTRGQKKRPKTAKNGQNNQFEWYLMPPKMGHRTSSGSSKTRQKTAKNNKNNPFDWSKIPSKMGQRTSSASGQKNSQITAQTAKNGQKWPTNSPGPRCHRRLVKRRRGRSGRFASRVEDLAVSSACRASDRAEISPPEKVRRCTLARCSSWRPR